MDDGFSIREVTPSVVRWLLPVVDSAALTYFEAGTEMDAVVDRGREEKGWVEVLFDAADTVCLGSALLSFACSETARDLRSEA